jgi:hypothetical protein
MKKAFNIQELLHDKAKCHQMSWNPAHAPLLNNQELSKDTKNMI